MRCISRIQLMDPHPFLLVPIAPLVAIDHWDHQYPTNINEGKYFQSCQWDTYHIYPMESHVFLLYPYQIVNLYHPIPMQFVEWPHFYQPHIVTSALQSSRIKLKGSIQTLQDSRFLTTEWQNYLVIRVEAILHQIPVSNKMRLFTCGEICDDNLHEKPRRTSSTIIVPDANLI